MTAMLEIMQTSSALRNPQVEKMKLTQHYVSQQQREMDEAVLSELVKQLSLMTQQVQQKQQQIQQQQQREMDEAILSELVKQLYLMTQQAQPQPVMGEILSDEHANVKHLQQRQVSL